MFHCIHLKVHYKCRLLSLFAILSANLWEQLCWLKCNFKNPYVLQLSIDITGEKTLRDVI